MNSFTQTSNYRCGSDYFSEEELYIQNVTLPGINFSTPEIGGRSGAKNLIGGDSFLYNTINIDIILDENLDIYKSLYKKMFKAIDIENGTFEPEDFDFWIEIAGPDGQPVLKTEYYGCKIESISDVDYVAAQDEEIVMSLTIRFEYFEIIDIDNDNIPTLKV